MSDRCPHCKEFMYSTPHRCLPEWLCRFPEETGLGVHKVRAQFPSEAAADALEIADAAEHDFMDQDVPVMVQRLGPDGSLGSPEIFTIRAEATISYEASEVEEGEYKDTVWDSSEP